MRVDSKACRLWSCHGVLRRCQKITERFFRDFHWSSRHLRPLLNREILSVEGLRLRIRAIVATESDAKPSASLGSYSCAGPNPHFSPSICYGTVGRALDCVRADGPILNAEAELAQAEADRREGHTIPTASRRWSDRRLFLARPLSSPWGDRGGRTPPAPQGGVW